MKYKGTFRREQASEDLCGSSTALSLGREGSFGWFAALFTCLGIGLLFFSSCQKDTEPDQLYVNPITLHLQYEMFGVNQPYTTPLTLQLSNVSEQLTLNYTTDLWGRITLDELLPGEYTINVVGALSREEVELVTGTPAQQGSILGGFLSGVKLKLGQDYPLSISLVRQHPSKLIFKELYYGGSRTISEGNYRNDGFFSIYNNTDKPLSLNKIYIANVENYGGIGAAGPQWPGESIGSYRNVYAQTVWKVVAGNDPVTVAPGQAMVIATMAAPHNKSADLNPASPVDLSQADYESYVVDPTNRYPDYPAANMKMMFWPSYSFLWRLGVFGQGMVLIEATPDEFASFETVVLPEEFQDPFEDEEYWICKKIPNAFVIDAVDLIQNNTATNTKRFHYSLDSGFATVGGTYLGKSVIRKISNVVDGVTYYLDTNNSTRDFEVNDHPLTR